MRHVFDDACLAVLGTRVQRGLVRRDPQDLLCRFAGHYQQLRALPRRTRRSTERRWKRTLSAIALLMTLGQVSSWAASIEVSTGIPPSIKSDGKCSLIEAIVNANRDSRIYRDCVAGAGADQILLPAMSEQRLKKLEKLPDITSQIVIEGRDSTILRNTTEPSQLTFFQIGVSGDLTLNETTVSGATASGASGGYGGINNAGGILALNDSLILGTNGASGVVNSGTATLKDSTVSGNGYFSYPPTDVGGGISNVDGGTLVLVNTIVEKNGAEFSGAGIFNGPDSSLTLIDSTVSQNKITYEGNGGGIRNHGTLVLVGSGVSGNRADFGGGISNLGSGTASVAHSTISGNIARSIYGYGSGGGIDNLGTLTLTNSTVSNNQAEYGAGLNLRNEGAVTIASSTVTGNIAQFEGGGLLVQDGTVTLKRALVSGNSAGSGREINNEPYNFGTGGVITADDYNLFGHDGDAGAVGFGPGTTDVVPNDPVDAILLTLADNGGPTLTHALAIGSAALNASPDDAACPATDQRGNPRPRGPACDIGAFEGSAVLCNGLVTTMVGTVGRDVLTGTPGSDVISGLGGNDLIVGLDGDDAICAGNGADRLYGGIGNDLLFGESGNDQLFGQRDDDTLDGGADDDQCDGGSHSAAGDTAVACETVSNVP